MDLLRRETLRESLKRIPFVLYSNWLDYFRVIWPGRVAIAIHEKRISVSLVDAEYSIFDDPRDPRRKRVDVVAHGGPILMDVDFEHFGALTGVACLPPEPRGGGDEESTHAFVEWRDRILDLPFGLAETQELALDENLLPEQTHLALYEDMYCAMHWPDVSVPWEWPASWGMTVELFSSPFHRQAKRAYCSMIQPLESEQWGSLGSPLSWSLREGDRALFFYPLADPVLLSLMYRRILFQLDHVAATVVCVVPSKWLDTRQIPGTVPLPHSLVWSAQTRRYVLNAVPLSLCVLTSESAPIPATRLVGLWDWRVKAHRMKLAIPRQRSTPPPPPPKPVRSRGPFEPSLFYLMNRRKVMI